MKRNRFGSMLLFLALTLLLGACGTLQLDVEGTADDSGQPPEEPQATAPVTTAEAADATAAVDPESSDPQRIKFTEIGISLEVPANLYVIKEPLVNLDDPSKLASYLFYIQNYGGNQGPGADYFQMYGHLQYDLPLSTWEQFVQVEDNTTEFAYINPVEINGVRGFEGQFSGTRNRFIYMFYLEGRVLSIAVADPTPENKVLADEIIQSLVLLPGGLSDASGVTLVSDPGGTFQVLLPEDWEYSFQPTAGIRLADLEAASPEAQVIIDDPAGPNSNISYHSGVTMSLVVLDDDSATLEPAGAQIESQQTVYFNGVEGIEYTFVEPSTVEGTLREVRVFNAGRSYLLRFGFADDASQDDLDRIIRSLTLAE